MLPALDTMPVGVPERTLGWGVLAWALPRFIQPDGPDAGKPYRPTDRQVRFLLWAYEVDERGRFTHRHLVRRLAKGSGKSPFAAFMACVELCGPVRFSHWSPAGEPVGKPESMPLVQIAATAESQTKNTSRYVRMWLAKGSPLQVEFDLDPGKMITYAPNGGELQVITSSSAAAEGAQPSFVILDETEHHVASNGGPLLFETLDRNVGKRGGRILETANAWIPGEESVAENTWTAFEAQRDGRVRARSRILYDAVEAPADTDLTDEDSLRTALETVYADCPWADIDTTMDRIWSPTTPASVSRRYYLNQRVGSEDAWTTPTQWASLADPTRVVTDGEEIVMFFDGSKSRDTTALVGCCVEDGHVFLVDLWEPDPGDPSDVVPVRAVDLSVRRAFEKYAVLGFFGDVQEWESFVKVNWPDEFGDQLMVHAQPTGKEPQKIAFDMRTNNDLFTKATELCLAEIEQGQFTHDGDARLARHVHNAKNRPNRWGYGIGKASKDSPHKIDGAICVIGSRMVRRQLLASKEYERRKRRSGGMTVW
jgi:hypothetical protein